MSVNRSTHLRRSMCRDVIIEGACHETGVSWLRESIEGGARVFNVQLSDRIDIHHVVGSFHCSVHLCEFLTLIDSDWFED